MGLLKLGSIYKKKSKKSPEVLAPPLPSKVEPISLELNLNLNQSSSIDFNDTNPKVTHKSNNDNNNAAPAGSGSLFEDIFAELGSKTTVQTNESGKAGQPSVFDNDFSLALALSHQLDLEQDSTNPMTGTPQSGNNTFNNNNNKSSNIVNNASNAPASNAPSNFLFGGDSIYSNYLKGLSALDNNDNGLSSSMFDSILNKNTTTTTTATTSTPSPVDKTTTVTPTNASPSYITQVVLDSDISDSDEESKNSEDSDGEYDLSNLNGKTQRRTKGVKPIMERRTQDNRLLVQRKIDNWSNRVDPESNRVESNESMIERMKDRHRNQVKLAALRNQQQQLDDYNMMGYPQQQPQHMVPQPYGAPTMMPLHTANGAVLQHPGLLMDPVQMYYPNPQLQPVLNDSPEVSMSSSNIPQPPPIPAAFLPNPTHHSLSAQYPSKDEEEHLPEQQVSSSQHYSSVSPDSSMSNSNTVMMNHSNNNSRTNSSTVNYSKTKISITPSSASSTTSSKNPSSLAVNLEEDSVYGNNHIEELPTTAPAVDDLPALQDIVEATAEEADCEISGDEENSASRAVTAPRRRKSAKKTRQQSKNDVPVTNDSAAVPRANDSGYTDSPQVVRSSRSTPNLKKGKKKSNPSSRNSSRRNSQDYTNSPTSELMVATPPPLPNSPYLHYNQNSDENLYYSHGHTALPRSSSQHQLHYQQQQHYHNQENRQSLRHMKSEPELPRRSNSTHSTSNAAYQQQKFYQQQQQLNLEWERMQSFQREQILKQNAHTLSQQPVSFMPMYTPMYYPTGTNTPPLMVGGMMMDPTQIPQQQQHQHQKYDTFPSHSYAMNASAPYNNNYQHQNQHKSSYINNYNSSTR
ncbi:unnamed protein product [Mucor hiemalis]